VSATGALFGEKEGEMTSNQQSASSGGIGFFGLLGIVFIILKLTGVIDWSWWLVLLPLYGGLVLLLAIGAVALLFYFFVKVIQWIMRKMSKQEETYTSKWRKSKHWTGN
jgi:hypothetical protein